MAPLRATTTRELQDGRGRRRRRRRRKEKAAGPPWPAFCQHGGSSPPHGGQATLPLIWWLDPTCRWARRGFSVNMAAASHLPVGTPKHRHNGGTTTKWWAPSIPTSMVGKVRDSLDRPANAGMLAEGHGSRGMDMRTSFPCARFSSFGLVFRSLWGVCFGFLWLWGCVEVTRVSSLVTRLYIDPPLHPSERPRARRPLAGLKAKGPGPPHGMCVVECVLWYYLLCLCVQALVVVGVVLFCLTRAARLLHRRLTRLQRRGPRRSSATRTM